MQPHADRWLAHTDAVLREAGLRTSPGRAAVTEICELVVHARRH